MEHGQVLRSGELARLVSVSPDTLRHYERVGVLPRPRRTAGGYRVYTQAAVEQVRLVRRALSLGFSLSEIARFTKARQQGCAPCKQVRALAAEKLAAVEERIQELEGLRQHLQAVLQSWDQRLSATPDGQRASLLFHIPEHQT